MTTDKMRAEFEKWAKAELTWPDQNFRLDAITGDSYFYTNTDHTYRIWQAAYAAGQKAEREAIQLKNWDGVRLGTTANRSASDERRRCDGNGGSLSGRE